MCCLNAQTIIQQTNLISQLSTENADLQAKMTTTENTANSALSKANEIPTATTSNNGQFLRVVNGAAVWATVTNAEEVSV